MQEESLCAWKKPVLFPNMLVFALTVAFHTGEQITGTGQM